MTWSLSRFRAGDFVAVRSREEILATLDEHGCVDGMPFMPEMLRFCGQRFRVGAVAHKTCDPGNNPGKGRRLGAAVHLEGLSCDGAAHGGCQAACNLFWKDVWLKPAGGPGRGSGKPPPGRTTSPAGGCTEARLLANTRRPTGGAGEEPRYSCQTTRLHEASRPLAWWDPRQYVFDVVTRNHSAGRVLRGLWLAALRWLLPRVPVGYRPFRSFTEWMHRSLTGRPVPSLHGKIGRGAATPTGRLGLAPGELVRIKSQAEIEQTVDPSGKNRGMTFDPEEMAPYCGRVFKVGSSVTRIIDERTGRMLDMKQPCITLEGVVCNAEYASCRLNCPRAIPSFWREIWLERVKDDAAARAPDRVDAGGGKSGPRDAPANGHPPNQRVALPTLGPDGPKAGAVNSGITV